MRNLTIYSRYYVMDENDDLLWFILRRRPGTIPKFSYSAEHDIWTRY